MNDKEFPILEDVVYPINPNYPLCAGEWEIGLKWKDTFKIQLYFLNKSIKISELPIPEDSIIIAARRTR